MKSQVEKSQELKDLLCNKDLNFAMECHSGLSAVIAEEAGFKCLWASGLSISAMTGCRDRNELDISEVCKIVEWMADHTNVPILVDGDTGGVDWRAAQVLVNKLVKAGAAGVCIEDKLYPKHNSFLSNTSDDLANPESHAFKIKAMKSENSEFVVVARLEGFISGSEFSDIVKRAEIYSSAGADAILVHSKIKDSSEIDRFVEYWKTSEYSSVPLVIVPTKYYKTPTNHFRELGISLVIWANHQMRASIEAMQEVCKTIYNEESLLNVEGEIATVSEIFRLQRDPEFVEEEKKYLPSAQGSSVILSATTARYNDLLPAALVPVNGKTILERQLSSLNKVGITRSVVVTGSRSQLFGQKYGVSLAHNANWGCTTEVGSALVGLQSLEESLPLYLSYGDLIYKDRVVRSLSNVDKGDIVLCIDPSRKVCAYNEIVSGSQEFSRLSSDDVFDVYDAVVGGYEGDLREGVVCGSFVGLLKVNTHKGYLSLKEALDSVSREDNTYRFVEVMRKLVKTCSVKGFYITRNEWVDVNTLKDLERATSI